MAGGAELLIRQGLIGAGLLGLARGLDAGPHWITNTHSNSHWTKPHNSLAGRASNIRWGKHVRMLMLLCYTEKAPNADAIV